MLETQRRTSQPHREEIGKRLSSIRYNGVAIGPGCLMIEKAVPASRAKSSGTEARSAVSTNGAKAKLTDLAYERIEEAIVTLALPPGSAISELQLSEMTGIGRTPIREAIQRLARERLIMV